MKSIKKAVTVIAALMMLMCTENLNLWADESSSDTASVETLSGTYYLGLLITQDMLEIITAASNEDIPMEQLKKFSGTYYMGAYFKFYADGKFEGIKDKDCDWSNEDFYVEGTYAVDGNSIKMNSNEESMEFIKNDEGVYITEEDGLIVVMLAEKPEESMTDYQTKVMNYYNQQE